MTLRFVDSAGSNTSPYDTWATAASSLTVIDGVAEAGDEVRVIDTHDHNNGATTTLNFSNGTKTNPVRVVSVSKGAAGNGDDDTYSAGAREISSTGASDFSCHGHVKFYGMTLEAGDDFIFAAAGMSWRFCECTLVAKDRMMCNQNDQYIEMIDCDVTLEDATQELEIHQEGSRLFVKGGTWTAANNTQALVSWTGNGDGSMVEFQDVDFSGCNTSISLATFNNSGGNCSATYRRCKFPSGVLARSRAYTAIGGIGNYVYTEQCSESNVTARPLQARYSCEQGDIEISTSSTRTGGMNDGDTDYSINLISNSTCSLGAPLVGWPIARNVDSSDTGYTVHLAHNEASSLKDDEFWIQVVKPSEAASPNTLVTHERIHRSSGTPYGEGSASPCSAEAGNTIATDSGETWSGSDTGTHQEIVGTIAPDEPGVLQVIPVLAKASADVYVDVDAGGSKQFLHNGVNFEEPATGGGGGGGAIVNQGLHAIESGITT